MLPAMVGAGKVSGVTEAVDCKGERRGIVRHYEAEQDVEVHKRLGALWLLRGGESVGNAADTAGVGRHTLTRWLSCYR